MEIKHFSGKLKSGHLLTLILSYYDYVERVKSLLFILAKSGKIFIEKNIEQIEHFCEPKPPDEIRLLFSEHQSIYLSPKIKHIQKLEIQNYSKVIRYAKCFENVESFGKIKFEGKNFVEPQADLFQPEVIEGFIKLVHKTSKLQIGDFYRNFNFLNQVIDELTKLHHLKYFAINLSLKYSRETFLRIFDLRAIEELKITTYEKRMQQHVFNILEKQYPMFQLSVFSFLRGQNFSAQSPQLPLNFSNITSKFQRLRKLRLELSVEKVGAASQIWQNLGTLEELHLVSNEFDFEILKFLPLLITLRIQSVKVLVKPTDADYFQNLQVVSYQLRIKDLDEKVCKMILEPLRKAVNISTNFPINSLAILNENESQILEELSTSCRLKVAPLVMSQLCQYQRLRFLDLSLRVDKNLKCFKKLEDFSNNYSIEHLTLYLYANDFFLKKSIQSNLPQLYTDVLLKFIAKLSMLKKLTLIDDEELVFIKYNLFFEGILELKPYLSLEIENLFHYGITDQLFQAMTKYNGKALTHLHIQSDIVSKSFFPKFLSILELSNTFISIQVPFCYRKEQNKEQFVRFFKAIAYNPQLREVTLVHEMKISQFKEFHFENLIIECCNNLRELRLIKNAESASWDEEEEREQMEWIQEKERMLKNFRESLPGMRVLTF